MHEIYIVQSGKYRSCATRFEQMLMRINAEHNTASTSNRSQPMTRTCPVYGDNATQKKKIANFHSKLANIEYFGPRIYKVTIGAYVKHLMMYRDGRFAKHPRLRYFA